MNKNVLRLVFITIVSTGLSAQMLQHEVEDGETLYGIARRYDMSLERLAEANELESPELLLPGTLLTIPTRYTVEKGDTLFSIARRFGSSVDEITRQNELSSSSIRVGQVLQLPPDIPLPARRTDQRVAGNQNSSSGQDGTDRSARGDDPVGCGR
jgi:LysM repeat protein